MAAELVIRVASADDAAQLTAFGRRVFAATFAADNDADDLQAYLDTAYTAAAQAAEIADAATTTLLACQDDRLMAFAQLRAVPPPACVDDPSAVEIWRFYVDPEWHGRGVAARLMQAVVDALTQRGASTAWLGVWERNPRAQAFYRKHGFTAVGAHTFMLGRDEQTDQIWMRRLQ